MCTSGTSILTRCVGVAQRSTTFPFYWDQSGTGMLLNADDEGVLITSMYEPAIGAAFTSSVDGSAASERPIWIADTSAK